MNTLFYGDNLDVLRKNVADASIDLVYLDPPFQSGKDYNVIFESHQGERGTERAQGEAFKDTWNWGRESEEQYAEIEATGGTLANALKALRSILGESDLMAYLCMMAPRLVELRRVLKGTGSLYEDPDRHGGAGLRWSRYRRARNARDRIEEGAPRLAARRADVDPGARGNESSGANVNAWSEESVGASSDRTWRNGRARLPGVHEPDSRRAASRAEPVNESETRG